MRLVVWSDKQGAWHCFQDRCPHRLAPLSEGVVEGDTLLCTYHGWQFNQAGKCTVIPQMEDAKAHATACASPRNCVKTFPVKVLLLSQPLMPLLGACAAPAHGAVAGCPLTQVEHGLLWVFPTPVPQGVALAATQPTMRTTVPGMVKPPGPGVEGNARFSGWFMRDLPLR